MYACTRTCMYVSMVTITRESCKSYEKAIHIELGHVLSKPGGASGNIGIQLPPYSVLKKKQQEMRHEMFQSRAPGFFSPESINKRPNAASPEGKGAAANFLGVSNENLSRRCKCIGVSAWKSELGCWRCGNGGWFWNIPITQDASWKVKPGISRKGWENRCSCLACHYPNMVPRFVILSRLLAGSHLDGSEHGVCQVESS